jgi:hypothetical protein
MYPPTVVIREVLPRHHQRTFRTLPSRQAEFCYKRALRLGDSRVGSRDLP